MYEDGWTNQQVQANPEGYKRWQEEQRDKAERERKQAREEDDFKRFAQLYEERGGDPAKAREMYSKYRSDMALEEAKKVDKQTRERVRTEWNRTV